MRSFLYFVPGSQAILDVPDVEAAGLTYALNGDRGVSCCQTSNGPGAQAGIVVSINAAEGDSTPPLYKPSEQTWQTGPPGKYWVGFQNDQQPGPADLLRPQAVGGEVVKLQDGNEWTIPICRSIVRGTSLPKSLVLGPDLQTWQLRAMPRFTKLCDAAEKVWEAFRNPDGDRITMDTQLAVGAAVDAIAVNYRVSGIEVSMLGLLSTQDMWQVLKAMIDGFEVNRAAIAAAKKNSPGAI